MAFYNKIRLPFTLYRAQFPVERTQFRKANGQVQTLSAVVRKTYAGVTDSMQEKWLQRLIIALNHDTIFATNDKYVGEIALEENGQIEWPDFKDYPLGKLSFQVQVTPFDATNMNCSSCDDLTQLNLVDDTFPAPIAAGDSASMNVFANDEICCNPVVGSITSINPAYVDSANIDSATGILIVNIKADAVDAAAAQLVTYRVTCPNGSYDEANVFGEIDGVTPPVCDPPVDLEIFAITTNSATVSIGDLNNPYIKISLCSSPATIIFSSAYTEPFVIGDHFSLSPGTCYHVEVYNFCDPEVSTSLTQEFTTEGEPADSGCGEYLLQFNDFRPAPLAQVTVTYTLCGESDTTIYIPNHSSAVICAIETSPGVPLYLVNNAVSPGSFTKTRTGNC